MKRFNDDTLEQAVNLLLDKSARMRPVKPFPAPSANFVIRVIIPVFIIGLILFTIAYFAMHPNL